MYTETKIKFTLTKTEKEALEKASEILSEMRDNANDIGSRFFDDADDVLEDITTYLNPTADSDAYVYEYEE